MDLSLEFSGGRREIGGPQTGKPICPHMDIHGHEGEVVVRGGEGGGR